MKLTKVEFFNYRSISGDDLDVEKDTTCLVGINEAGKSNILYALEKLGVNQVLTQDEFSRHSEEYGSSENPPELKVTYSLEDKEKEEIAKVTGKEEPILVLRKTGGHYVFNFPGIDYGKSKYFPEIVSTSSEEANESEKRTLTEEEKQEVLNKIWEDLRNNYLPNFLRFDSVNFNDYYLPLNGEVLISDFILDPNVKTPVKNLLNLGGIQDFKKLQASTDTERIRRDVLLKRASEKINKEILGVVWPVETVKVELDADGDILKIRLKEENSTNPFKPEERSRGLQWALAFNIFFLAMARNSEKQSILLIDEPGIFLHINAQKKLLEQTFNQITKNGHQIIYTTHLPYLIDPNYPERIRILEKDKEDTHIGNKAWSEGEFGKIPEPVRTALGLQWSDIFNLGEKNVIVEGPSDQIILRDLANLFFENSSISFLPSYGVKKIPSILAIIKLEDKEAFAVVDGDIDIEELRKKSQLVAIEAELISNIPSLTNNLKMITIEDILPKSVFQNAVFHVYESSSKKRGIKLELKDIPTEYPRVAGAEEFFSKKFKAKKHKLLKMEIAREIHEEIKSLNKENLDVTWNSCKNLISEIFSKLNVEQAIHN
ncbi:MAG TPA: ATP-binding protein [Candidatus Eisenbacteria bacterium]|nr:ATP-binding protein [Candidatus Eisenbacteria bacterium]